jgi:hypothetical protein
MFCHTASGISGENVIVTSCGTDGSLFVTISSSASADSRKSAVTAPSPPTIVTSAAPGA